MARGAYTYIQIFGKKDNHVPAEGRDLIRKTLHEKGVSFSFYEVAHAQRKLFLPFFPPPAFKTPTYKLLTVVNT